MILNQPLVITPTNPASSEMQKLIAELDEYLAALYPPESIHGLNFAAVQPESVTVLVAKFGADPVGCGTLRRLEPGFAEVKRMYVRPVARGCGVGRQLLSAIEAIAKQAHVHTLRLETGVHQPEAIRLYERAGFYPIPPFGDYKPDPLCLFFEKPLT